MKRTRAQQKEIDRLWMRIHPPGCGCGYCCTGCGSVGCKVGRMVDDKPEPQPRPSHD